MKMTCADAQEKLQAYVDEELESEPRRLFQEHVAACKTCRQLVVELQHLTLDIAGSLQARRAAPASLKRRVQEKITQRPPQLSPRVTWKGLLGEGPRGRRLIFAGAMLLVIAIGLGIFFPGRANRVNAKTVLAEAMAAARRAKSIHYVFQHTSDFGAAFPGREDADQSPDVWVGERGYYYLMRALTGDIIEQSGFDLAADSWWLYREGCLYQAKLSPIGEPAHALAADCARDYLSSFYSLLDLGFTNPREEFIDDERNGRPVTRLSVSGAIPDLPGTKGRNVFVFDKETHRLLAMQMYMAPPGKPELLIAHIDKIEYDQPAPAALTEKPKGATLVPARAKAWLTLGLVPMTGPSEGNPIDTQTTSIAEKTGKAPASEATGKIPGKNE